MRILFIAPLPPPIGGHSLASKVLLDELVTDHKVEVVDFNKDSFKEGAHSLKRIFQVVKILHDIWRRKKGTDAMYLTISESFAGNIKDLFTYLICFRSLSKMYIHLHGGSIKRLLWDRHRVLLSINRIFIKKLAGVIISGQSHRDIFDDMIHRKKIHIVPNFAQDHLFATEEEIREKFSSINPLRILFVSNFIPKKGFNELVDAYFGLSSDLKKMVRIECAGRFESESEETMFLDKIDGAEQIRYHGFVGDVQKKTLFSQAHIFCLPTAFLEGQPLSILEAYASGCVVVTTGLGGIRDVFEHGVNGFEVQERSADSIKSVLEDLIERPENLLQIAISNRRLAGEEYRVSIYGSSLREIIEGKRSGSR